MKCYELPNEVLGRQTTQKIYLPLCGPFIYTNQGYKGIYVGMRWDDALEIANAHNMLSERLELHIGQVVYQSAEDGTVTYAGMHLDTSD